MWGFTCEISTTEGVVVKDVLCHIDMKRLSCQVYNRTKRKLNLMAIKKKLLEVHKRYYPEYFGHINVVFVGDKRMIQLNRDYLKRNRPTDVISFYYAFPPDITGDIFISVPQAIRQSKSLHSLQKELFILAVHGFLHLAGYTDYNIKKYRQMHQIQDKIIEELCSLY